MLRNPFTRKLGGDRIRELVAAVSKRADDGDAADAYDAAKPLLGAAKHEREAAFALASLLDGGRFAVDRAPEVIGAVLDHEPADRTLLADLGAASSGARDWNYLNDAPPDDDRLVRLAKALEVAVAAPQDDETRRLHYGLATICRVLGRSWDELAERSYLAALEAQPDRWQLHYDVGLFYKTRGRFAAGVEANQRAYDLGGGESEAVRWNLGICATGAREAEIALRIWKENGQKIEMGRFGLPEGGYPSTKVRLAKHPLVDRTGEDDAGGPGLEETIWLERLSPCHGIIRSVLFGDLGVDYGDVVLFDGAPITYHKYGDDSVPVFPHLATLEHRGYQLFNFAGTQSRREEIADLTDHLPEDAVVYSHTEQYVNLCNCCWENPELDHQHDASVERHVVSGQIAAPPDLAPSDLQVALDAALAQRDGVRLMAPGLADAAGDAARAEVEGRRYEMLISSRES